DFRRIARQRSRGDEVHVGQYIAANGIVQPAATPNEFAEALAAFLSEVLMDAAIAEVRIHQQDALVGRTDDRSQVDAGEGFPDAGRWSGDHDNVVAAFFQTKAQGAAQTPKAFYRRGIGGKVRQHVAAARTSACLLDRCGQYLGYRREHVKPEVLLDIGRGTQTRAEQVAQYGQCDAQYQARNCGDRDGQCLVRLHRHFRHAGRVDQAYAADLAFLNQSQLLGAVQ